MDYEIDYNEQMLNYYPEVIKAIREFQIMISTQSIQVEEIHKELNAIFMNAYIDTADEATIAKWEKLLGITPLPQGEDSLETWLNDRQESIAAKLYSPEKLNTTSISNIVKIFTGGSVNTYFRDSTIHILINPPNNSKQYKFENVEQALGEKIPAHLKWIVSRNYYTWLQVKDNFNTWGDVESGFTTWEELLFTLVNPAKI